MLKKCWEKLRLGALESSEVKKPPNADSLGGNAKIFRASIASGHSRFEAVAAGSNEHQFALDYAREILKGGLHVLSDTEEMAGIWRVFQPGEVQLHFIVGSGDMNTDVAMTQCLHYYGTPTRQQSVEDMFSESRFGRVAALCGGASVFVREILKILGHDARVITSLRGGNLNSYDNGHTVLEVMGEMGNWQVFDPGYGGWLTQEGEKLNLLRLHNSIDKGLALEFEPTSFRHYGKFYASNGSDLTIELESKWMSPDEIIRWYRAVFQLVGVEKKWLPGQFEFLTRSDSEKRKVEEYGTHYSAISSEEFVVKYG